MTVVERKPVPIYEFVCDECKSRIQYKRSEVSFTDHVTCPVCGMTKWAETDNPIGWEYPKEEEQIIDPCDLVKDLAERIGIHQLYAIVKDMRGEG